MKIKDIMTKSPVTVKESDTLEKVVKVLADRRITGLPVVSRSKLVGIVTRTDVIRAVSVYDNVNVKDEMFSLIVALLGSKDEKVNAEIGKILKSKVRDFAQREVICIDADEDIYRSAALINMHKIDRLPVVRKGRLVGIVTKSDIIMALSRRNS